MNDAQYSEASNTYYAGNYIYNRAASRGATAKLTFFNSEEGYVEPVFEQVTVNSSFGSYTTTRLTGFEYTYQYKDHLGNIRLAYQDMNGDGVISAETEIKEENHYYPFGLKHKGYNNIVTGRNHNYGFGGKEEQSELGLEWHDFHARNYDASLGRWMNIDPLAEKYYDKSTYNYTLNNPVFFIDPDGRTVNVSDLVNGNTEEDTWLLLQLMANLSEISGEVISVDKNDNLSTGNCIEDSNSSASASSYISNLINDDSSVINVKNNSRNTITYLDKRGNLRKAKDDGSQAYPDGNIYLDVNQIYSFQEALKAKGIDERSINAGFVFLHETLHTKFGASYYNSKKDEFEKDQYDRFPDTQGSFIDQGGPTVQRVNLFRREMSLSQRMAYSAWENNRKVPGTLLFEKDGESVKIPVIMKTLPKTKK